MKQRSTRWLISAAAAAMLIGVAGIAARAQDTGDDTAPPPPPPPPPPAATAPADTTEVPAPPPPPGGPRRGRGAGFGRFNGTVASVSATGFTFTSRRGNETITVTTTPQTTYSNTHDGAVSDIKTGDTITAMGQSDATAKTVQAFRIVDGDMPNMMPGPGGPGSGGPGGGRRFGGPGGPGGRGGFGGLMTKGTVVSTAPLKLKDATGVVYTVTPADPSGVSFSVPGKLADVKVGKYVAVRPQNSVGTPITATTTAIKAQSVVISPTAPRRGGFGGGGFGRPGGLGGGG